MKKLLLAALLATLLVFPACSKSATSDASGDETGSAGGSGKPVETYDEVTSGTEFHDITLPGDLTRVSDETNFFETRQFKMGILVYEGRVDFNSLIDFMINTMVKRKWVVQSTLKSARTTLVFEKPNKNCVIQISEGTIYTRMTVTAVELKTGSSASSTGSSSSGSSGSGGSGGFSSPSGGTKTAPGELKPAFKNEKNLN
jgi:hypothetical protein